MCFYPIYEEFFFFIRLYPKIRKTKKKLREEFPPQIKHHIWKDGTPWPAGYYVASVSDGATSDVVAEYIRSRWQRPYKKTDDFEKLHATQKTVLSNFPLKKI